MPSKKKGVEDSIIVAREGEIGWLFQTTGSESIMMFESLLRSPSMSSSSYFFCAHQNISEATDHWFPGRAQEENHLFSLILRRVAVFMCVCLFVSLCDFKFRQAFLFSIFSFFSLHFATNKFSSRFAWLSPTLSNLFNYWILTS